MERAEYGEEASDRRPCEEHSLQARCAPPDRGNASQVVRGRGVTVWCAELSSSPVWRRSAAEVKHGVLATLAGAPSAGNAAPTHEQTCSARMAADTTAAVANNSDSNNVCVACPSNSESELLADVTTTTSALLEVTVGASDIRDEGMRPLPYVAAAAKSMSVVGNTAGVEGHTSTMKKKEPRSARRRMRSHVGPASARPVGVFAMITAMITNPTSRQGKDIKGCSHKNNQTWPAERHRSMAREVCSRAVQQMHSWE